MQIGQAIGETGPAMHQSRGRLPRHAAIAVGGPCHHPFEKSEHTTHAGRAVERGDEIDLARSRIGETGVAARSEKGSYEAFRAIHRFSPVSLRIAQAERAVEHRVTVPGRRIAAEITLTFEL